MSVRVAYAGTADGFRIAFTSEGQGPPIVYMPPMPMRHVVLERQLPEDGRWLERLQRGHTVIEYDPRGLGLSQRGVEPYALDGLVADLAAVVAAAGHDRVALLACLNAAPVAIAFAAREPDRISHLVLWCASSRMAATLPPPVATLTEIIEKDWDLVVEAAAHVLAGWHASEAAHRYAEFIRACVDPRDARALLKGLAGSNVDALLPAVRAPTLVLHRRSLEWTPLAHGMDLASRIPGARLQIFEGDLMHLGVGDIEPIARAVEEFTLACVPGVSDAPASAALAAREAQRAAREGGDRRAGGGGHRFVREGQYWTLEFEGRLCRLRDTKGLRHIARLLREPGCAVPAAELARDAAGVERGAAVAARPSAGEHSIVSDLGDAGPLLDAKAKAEYRRRLHELRQELADAESCNDAGRIAAARAEIETVGHELSAALGLGGRDRKAGSASERARLAVTKRIKAALASIRAHHPALGDHLVRAIKTGHFCVYDPGGDSPPAWEVGPPHRPSART